MDVVLDTVVLNHLIRTPKRVPGIRPPRYRTALDAFIEGKRLRLGVDDAKGLISEWERSCGTELVQQIFTRWVDLGGVAVVAPHSIKTSTAKKLRSLGFTDTVDKLVVRIALAAADRVVVSHDSDFWDPSDADSVGDATACVAQLLQEELEITVMILRTLVRSL